MLLIALRSFNEVQIPERYGAERECLNKRSSHAFQIRNSLQEATVPPQSLLLESTRLTPDRDPRLDNFSDPFRVEINHMTCRLSRIPPLPIGHPGLYAPPKLPPRAQVVTRGGRDRAASSEMELPTRRKYLIHVVSHKALIKCLCPPPPILGWQS